MTHVASDALLVRYHNPATWRDLKRVNRLGIETSVGCPQDQALHNLEAIERVFLRLQTTGVQFRRSTGPAHPHLSRAIGVLQSVPATPVSTLGRRVSRSIHTKVERVRADLLYNQPDVQAWPWHVQGGRALALGTIVDAHELDVSGSPGVFSYMSGRLRPEIAEHVFGPHAGWLSGYALRDALVQAQARHFPVRPHAIAKQRADKDLMDLREFTTSPVRMGFKEIVTYCFDSLGIRSRKDEVAARIAEHLGSSNAATVTMLSIGCGTAIPMLEVLQSAVTQGRSARLILIDQDPIALAAAEQLARQLGLQDLVEIHCERLLGGRGRRTRVLDLEPILQGRQVDVCEDSGLREYFPGFLYRDLAAKAWAAVKPGGLMTTGNMNVNRPQPEFLHGLMGWPIPVQMRSAEQVVREHLAVGVPAEVMQIRMTPDHVYAVCSAVKPH